MDKDELFTKMQEIDALASMLMQRQEKISEDRRLAAAETDKLNQKYWNKKEITMMAKMRELNAHEKAINAQAEEIKLEREAIQMKNEFAELHEQYLKIAEAYNAKTRDEEEIKKAVDDVEAAEAAAIKTEMEKKH